MLLISKSSINMRLIRNRYANDMVYMKQYVNGMDIKHYVIGTGYRKYSIDGVQNCSISIV